MFKFLTLSFMIVFFGACGVSTSSTPTEKSTSDTSTDSNTDNTLLDPNPVYTGDTSDTSDTSDTGLDLIDPNPIYDGGSDTNNTDTNDDSNSTDGTVVADQNNSIFDVSGAVLDKFACMIGDPNQGYTNRAISDTSSDDKSEEDLEYGVLINSSFIVDRTDPDSSRATLFYYDLKVQRDMVWQNIYATRYRIAVDTAWERNDKKVIYVMTPKNTYGYYGCYRYDFSLLSEGTYSSTKVYRNNI